VIYCHVIRFIFKKGNIISMNNYSENKHLPFKTAMLLLQEINNGKVKITSNLPVSYCGDVEYLILTGKYKNWKIIVFNDCNYWDYVDCIIDDKGNEYYELNEQLNEYETYWPSLPSPTDSQSKLIWQI
jgi:hypothetical protein